MIVITVREQGELPTRAAVYRLALNVPEGIREALVLRYGELANVVWDGGGPRLWPSVPGTYRATVEPHALLPRQVVVSIKEQGELFGRI